MNRKQKRRKAKGLMSPMQRVREQLRGDGERGALIQSESSIAAFNGLPAEFEGSGGTSEPSEVETRASEAMRRSNEQLAEFLIADELCAMLRISRATLDRQVKVKSIPRPLKIGNQLRWLRTTIDEWIRGKVTEAA